MSEGKQSDPTMRLRWVEADEDYAQNKPAVRVKKYVTYYYKLQQYWQNSDGSGEWRDIDIEYE